MAIPDPALVVLVGASGVGKSVWAQERYRRQEIVSSDDLRGIVGSGRHDLDATDDAFLLLDQIIAARAGRRLMTVVDTLGLDVDKRRSYLAVARETGLPAVVVYFDTPADVCRRRNAERDRPVPAPVLAAQIKRAKAVEQELEDEPWDLVVTVSEGASVPTPQPRVSSSVDEPGRDREVVLQISRFPWGEEDPAVWLKDMVLAADEVGFAGVALMDHLIQIPQVGRAWDAIPEPFTTLGMLAGLDTKLRLGPLCTPVTFRRGGIIAKTIATLDVLSRGRAFVGLGAGWFEREHRAFDLPLPQPRERLAELERTIEIMRAMWSTGTKAYSGEYVTLPETTSYPRPVGQPQIIVGGAGDGTLRIAAELGDACNVRTTHELESRLAVFEKHRDRTGRDVAITVLDLPVIGRDREDVWRRVEKHRGNTPAATFAQVRHASTVTETAARHRGLFGRGVSTIFLALPDLDRPEDVAMLGPLVSDVE